MNLIELRDRLTDIISENERTGRTERNALPVVVRVNRKRARNDRRRTDFQAFPVRFVSSGMSGYGNVALPSALPEYAHVMEINAGPSIVPERSADTAWAQANHVEEPPSRPGVDEVRP